MENLVSVNVPDSRHVLLVEEERFQGLTRSSNQRSQSSARKVFCDRVDSESGERREFDGCICGVIDDHLSERALVNEPALGAIVKVHDNVRMRWTVGTSRRNEYLAAHP